MELTDLVSESLLFTVLGDPLKGMEKGLELQAAGRAEVLFPVRVVGFKALGSCQRLPTPIVIFLPGEGEDPKGDCGWHKPTLKWVVEPSI
jgi:hypothetical protein